MSGLLHAFDIGYRGSHDVNIVGANLSSAAMHPDFVSTYLAKYCKLNELLGPFTSNPFPFSRCFGVGCVPKKSGRLRLIHHFSGPEGDTVNDGISREDYSVQYVSIDRAIDAIMRYRTSAQLFKLDVQSAFRIIPVWSEDWPLLGISWQGQYHFDTVLPFGLRSSPAIFISVTECIEWIIFNEFSIPDLLHYLDDFLCISATALMANQHAVILLRAFNYLGIPLAAEKVEGPLPVLCFLGIELDCQQLEAETPGATVPSYQVLYLPNHYSERTRILSGEALVRSTGDHPRSDLHEETVEHVQALPKAALQDPPVRRCSRMPVGPSAGVRVTATGGFRTNGPHIRQLTTSYGRSCTPLPLHAPPGGTNGK